MIQSHSRISADVARPACAAALHPAAALDRLERAPWVIAASHAGRRSVMLVDAVVRAGVEPPLVAVIAPKGHWVEPLIRDSHRFAVSLLSAGERVLLRRLAGADPRDPGDPLDLVAVERLESGAPVLRDAGTVFDCDVHRHVDIESDRQVYVGLVVAGRVNGVPIIPQPIPSLPVRR